MPARLLTVWLLLLVALGALLSYALPNVAYAQDGEAGPRLRLRRDFGYGSGAQIQGRFSLLVDGDDNIERVVFYLDEEPIGEDTEAPFRLPFNTGGYELGWHTFHAVAFTAGGQEVATNTIQRQFVSGSTTTLIVIGALVLIVGLRVVSHFVTRDKSAGQKGVYGIYGGAICPRCGRPFSRHWWAPNLVAGKLDRCPHCGKWHFSTRATPQMLASAEQFAEELDAEEAPDVAQPDAEELLRRRLEESRFDDE